MRLAVPSCVVSSFRETFPDVFKDYTSIQDSRRPLKICDRLGSVFSLLDFHVDHSNGIEFV